MKTHTVTYSIPCTQWEALTMSTFLKLCEVNASLSRRLSSLFTRCRSDVNVRQIRGHCLYHRRPPFLPDEVQTANGSYARLFIIVKDNGKTFMTFLTHHRSVLPRYLIHHHKVSFDDYKEAFSNPRDSEKHHRTGF